MKNYISIDIDTSKLYKSKYSDVKVVKYIPAEEHPQCKNVATVDFVVRKLICADTEEEISNLINKELES